MEIFYRKIIARLIHFIYNPEYFHFDKLPKYGGALIICNHVSYMDGLIIASGSKRPIRFVIDTDIYNLPIINHIMRQNRAIPILPNRKSVSNALREISEGLRAGDLICIFPEGKLTYTGGIGRFRTGIEHILATDPADIYPMAITGLWGSIFSRKYLGTWKQYFPFHLKNKARIICGDKINGDEANINSLQNEVLRLKYLIPAK